MRRRKTICLAVLLMLGLTPSAHSSPTNDDFANAAGVGSLPFVWNIEDAGSASRETGEPYPCSGPRPPKTLWFRVTPADASVMRITTEGSVGETVLAVFTGAEVSSLTEIHCATGFQGPAAIYLDAIAATTYYIQLSGWFADGEDAALSVEAVSQPSNDNFDQRHSVDLEVWPSFTQSLDTALATTEDWEPISRCAPIGRTVWYRVHVGEMGQPPGVGAIGSTITVSTSGSDFDTVLAIYAKADLGLVEVACSDDAGGKTSEITLPWTFDQAVNLPAAAAAGCDFYPLGWPEGAQAEVEACLSGGTRFHTFLESSLFVQVGGYGGTAGELQFNLSWESHEA